MQFCRLDKTTLPGFDDLPAGDLKHAAEGEDF